MEYLKPVQMVVIEYLCDMCEEGNMRQHGHPERRGIPWRYPHVCDNCGYYQLLDEPPYPRTDWREIKK